MKNRVWRLVWLPIIFFGLTIAVASRAAAQDASIEFGARATPSAGLEEPVRGFPFFLLSKSFAAIEQEADAAYPKPDMDAFIKTLDVSSQLKAWMKKNDWVTLSGENFTHKLRADDILEIPEFKKAYMDRNSGDQSADFPKPPKIKPSDRAKNPAKFDKISADYVETIRRYIEQHPQSTDGIDLNLTEIDPSPKWNSLLGARTTAIHRRTLDLAQSTYMVARTETNLQGQGVMRGLAPGTYWLSTLDVPATIGDARPRWDIPVVVRAGETKFVALTSANSIRPQASQ